MKWAVKIGRFVGIDVYLHLTFFLLIGWIGVQYWNRYGSFRSVLAGIGFLLAVFLCVVLHEFGHALTARHYGIGTRDIIMTPLGGVARLERNPSAPKQELWVAAAGPLVNVAIALLLAVWLWLTSQFENPAAISMTGGNSIERLMIANLLLVGFNILPAFPLDGGRVVRALFAMRMSQYQATRVTTAISFGLAVILGIAGFLYDPTLAFAAFFVLDGAQSEARFARLQSWLAGVPVSAVMSSNFYPLRVEDPLNRAIDMIVSGGRQDFPVVDGDVLVGMLEVKKTVKALRSQPTGLLVSDLMTLAFIKVSSDDMLDKVLVDFQGCACSSGAVVDQGQMIGVISLDEIGIYVQRNSRRR